MKFQPTVSFLLGSYSDHPEFEDLCYPIGHITVRKSKDNFCKINIDGKSFTTTELDLELTGGSWYLDAHFEIPNFNKLLSSFRSSVFQGKAILHLGKLKFESSRDENEHLLD